MRRLHSFPRLLALSLALSLAAVSGAQATPTIPPPDVYSIHGIVRDPIQRLMSFVRVQADPIVCNGLPESCTSRSDVTNTVGAYEIGESATGTFQLTATRDDVVATATPVTVTAPIPTQVDLVVKYRISGSLLRTALSTATGSASTPLTIVSYAPLPGSPGQAGGASCVKVTDSRTGTTLDAALVSSDSRTSTWTFDLFLPQASPEGTFTLSFEADDCQAATQLTEIGSVNYVVDNTAPLINQDSLIPLAGTNVLVSGAGQPLLVRVADSGSGLTSAGIRNTLLDETAGSSVTFSGSSVAYSAISGWATTSPVTLVAGHRYRTSVEATDLAGNTTTLQQASTGQGGGLLASAANFTTATARIPPTNCSVSPDIDLGTGTRAVTCENVPIELADSSVTLSGSLHPGVGAAWETISLDDAILSTSIAGVVVTQAARPSGDPAWAPWTEILGWDVPIAHDSPNSYIIAGRTVYRSRLETRAPATWTSASISMTPTNTGPHSPACGNPVTSAGCYPDPVRPWLPSPGETDTPLVRQLSMIVPTPLPSLPTSPASATALAPVESQSYYVLRNEYDAACPTLACANNPITSYGRGQPRGHILAILSFGGVCDGTHLSAFEAPYCVHPAEVNDVMARSSWYFYGYLMNSSHNGSGRVGLAVGTNNSIPRSDAVMEDNGSNFNNAQDSVGDYYAALCSLYGYFFSAGFTCEANGANDVETQWPVGPIGVLKWFRGYFHAFTSFEPVFNYGAMYGDCASASCWSDVFDNGWTPHQVCQAFAGCPPYDGSVAMPQIYSYIRTVWWGHLKSAAYAAEGETTIYYGVLWGCNTGGNEPDSEQAWQDFRTNTTVATEFLSNQHSYGNTC